MKAPILAFDVSGHYAHFRVRYTTTSPITHLVPPRHTVSGIIGAILGVQREDVSEVFSPEHSMIGIELYSKLSTLRLMTKLLKLKGGRTLQTILGVKEHILVPTQLVREPRYRIYFAHDDPTIMNRLEKMLQNKECIYSPSLGSAQYLAETTFISRYEAVNVDIQEIAIQGKPIQTRSIAPLSIFNPLPNPTNHFVIDKFARHLSKERIPDGFYKVIFDANGNTMTGNINPEKHHETMNAKLLRLLHDNSLIFVW